jgi:hypothetical protein
MDMPREQSDKLKRYLINADPFLWDVLRAKNKRGRIKELQEMGPIKSYPEKSSPTYSKINQDLLVELGIEGILKEIVKKQIDASFAPDHISYFRRCWQQGQTPDMKYLKKERLYYQKFFSPDKKVESNRISGHRSPAFIFLQIHQKEFVERWTVFGGLWFEEIEPFVREQGNRA